MMRNGFLVSLYGWNLFFNSKKFAVDNFAPFNAFDVRSDHVKKIILLSPFATVIIIIIINCGNRIAAF